MLFNIQQTELKIDKKCDIFLLTFISVIIKHSTEEIYKKRSISVRESHY